MALPEPNTAWPPKRLDPVYGRIATWAAWYGGDPADLAAIYGGSAGSDPSGTGFFASERGGFRAAVKRAVDRWFWGSTPPAGEQRTKLHVPLAGDIATTSADLLFSEPPTVTAEDTATQGVLDELVDDRMHANLLEAAEIAAALGGVYLRIMWNRAVSRTPWIAAVHPDAAVPEFIGGRLAAVTFWCVLAEDGQRVVRHLERHEPGAILHGVYDGDRDSLGRLVPLTEYAETRALSKGLADGNRVDTAAPNRLTACYIPNMRPARCWRNIPAGAYQGRADIQGAEPLLDALDETWSSWMRDLRLGKGRVITARAYLENNGPGKGASFDPEREIYEALDMLPGQGPPITIAQFAIRVDEHDRTATAIAENVIRAAGYSQQSFGMTGDVAMTATEVTARERRSFITRGKKTRYWRPELAELLETLLVVLAGLFEVSVTPEKPEVEFGDSVQDDPESTARTLQLLEQARAASTEVKVRMLHPEWDDPAVAEEVQRIQDENGTAVPAADAFGGGPPVGVPPDQVPADQSAA